MKPVSRVNASLRIKNESIEILWCSAMYASMSQIRERLKKQLITQPSENELAFLLDSYKSKVTLAEEYNFIVHELTELKLNLSFDVKRLKDLLDAGRHVFSLVEQPYNFFCDELISNDIKQNKINLAWLIKRENYLSELPETSNYRAAILTIMLCWFNQTKSELELKYRKTKEAWRSKKHRDSHNGKKACSYMLSEEHIELLEKLCKRNRRKTNEMIEILIENACEQLGITKKPPRM